MKAARKVDEALRAEAREAVAKMPPLTAEQRDVLTDLLSPYAGKTTQRQVVARAQS